MANITDDLHFIKIAHKLNKEMSVELEKHDFHFRGNMNSFSLVSLSKDTPEIGFSGLRTEKTARKRFAEFLKGKSLTRGRETREKELQAWLIKDALKNNNELYFDKEVKFLTSELSIKNKNTGKRLVNDILGIDNQNNLVVIELKCNRNKSILEDQILDYIEGIKQWPGFFEELVTVLGSSRTWNGKIRGIAVWPESARATIIRWAEGIKEFTYLEKVINGKKQIAYDSEGRVKFIPK